MKIFRLFVLLLLSAPAFGGVYKWIDTSGAVHFSDKPPATAAEKLDIETSRTPPEQLIAQLDEPETADETVATEQQNDALQAERDRAEQQRKIQISENCNRARRAHDSLLSASRVYEPLPGGGRRYLEDDEVARRKADAERDVDEWCNQSS